MSEIELRREGESGGLAAQMSYARALAAGSMLPGEYRNQPANVLIAVGLGQSMGLSPAESLYRISVIKGKPTASAELIAACVRKAGHKLRVTSDATSATATIIRADDPDFEHTVTRDIAWAKSMGLDRNDNYKKQPGTMLQWRAITACARLACPEALYGVSYTPDEMHDYEPTRQAPTGLASVLPQTSPAPDGPTSAEPPAPPAASVADEGDSHGQASAGEPYDVTDAEIVEDKPLTARTRGRMFALFGQKGVPDDQQLPGINHILGTRYVSRSELTEDDARQVIAVLEARPDAEQEGE